MPSVIEGMKEEEIITVFEIAMIALDIYLEEISRNMDLEPSYLKRYQECLNRRLDTCFQSEGGK